MSQDETSADIAATRAALDESDDVCDILPASEEGSLPSRLSSNAQSDKVLPGIGRETSFKFLGGRKWSSRLGLKRKDSLEADARRIKGVEVAEPHYGSQKLPWALTLTLAYQTIGVVYGDLGTSPLYVYAAVFSDRHPTNDEVRGCLSIIIYTFTIIPLLKYVFIVLHANDHGNGGTFALYSKICRHARLSVARNQAPEDQELSIYNFDASSSTFQRSSRLKAKLQKSPALKTVLLSIAVVGTCMVIGDGVLTPSISVLSAIQGIKTAVPSVSQSLVVAISCVILVLLFSLQRFGPDKVGYTFSPVVLIWFISIGIIGVYNIIKHDPTIFRSFNPYYIYLYFRTGKKAAWTSLGGAVLCITGTEAMFADLGHFSVRAIQIAFTSLVYPCLLLAYIGQAAYLIKFPEHVDETFFKSIPSSVYWPMFVVATGAAIIASQAMISATFSIVYQAMALGCFPRVTVVHTSKKYAGQIYIPEMNWIIMVLCVAIAAGFQDTSQIGNAYGVAVTADMLITTNLLALVLIMIWQKPLWMVIAFEGCLCSMELLYFSSVLQKVPQGGWVPLVFVVIFSCVMFTWYYGRSKKYQYEVQHKVSIDWVLGLGSDLGMARVPGIGLVYTELAQGVPVIFAHLVSNLPAMHSILVFVCIKHLPLPNVPDEERFLIRRIGPKQFRMFRCAVRFGYLDDLDEDDVFESLLVQSLFDFIRAEFMESRSDGNNNGPGAVSSRQVETQVQMEETTSNSPIVPMNMVEAAKRLSNKSERQQSPEEIPMTPLRNTIDFNDPLVAELNHLQTARNAGIVYMLGQTDINASKDSSAFKKFVIDAAYNTLKRNSGSSKVSLHIPNSRLLLVGMIHKI